jgi:hypothetical protein
MPTSPEPTQGTIRQSCGFTVLVVHLPPLRRSMVARKTQRSPSRRPGFLNHYTSTDRQGCEVELEVVAGLLFGGAPAWRASRVDSADHGSTP